MSRLASIAFALLLALLTAAPALGGDLQSTDTLDQRLDQGAAFAFTLTGSDRPADAASQRSAVCAAATLVHNCGVESAEQQIIRGLTKDATRANGGGLTREEGDILTQWGREYGWPGARGPEIHDVSRPGSWGGMNEHWHIGPGMNHIPLAGG